MPETNDTPPIRPRTEAQKEAARINGAKSRGPVSPMGKSICALNALRHGLTTRSLTLANEDRDAFRAVLEDYMNEYQPQGPTETNLVEDLAIARWQQYRGAITEVAVYNCEMSLNNKRITETFECFEESLRTADAIETSLARSSTLPHLLRCQIRANRDFHRALNALLALRKRPSKRSANASITPEIAETDPAISLQTNESTASETRRPESHTLSRTAVKALSPVVLAAAAAVMTLLHLVNAQPPADRASVAIIRPVSDVLAHLPPEGKSARRLPTFAHRGQPQIPLDDHSTPVQPIVPPHHSPDRLRINAMLLRQNPRRQAIRRIPIQHRHHRLLHNRTRIQILIHKMHRAAAVLHPIQQRLMLCVKPWKRGQQRGVDIQNPHRERTHKVATQQPHVSSQANQIDLVLVQQRHQLTVKSLAIDPF